MIPDEVYDRLVEGTELEHKVGAKLDGVRIPHPFPMYSLQKVFLRRGQPTRLESYGTSSSYT